MQIKTRTVTPYPGYENHVAMMLNTDSGERNDMKTLQEKIKQYRLGPGTIIKDLEIPGTEPDCTLKLRFIIPSGLPKGCGILLNIHGGGFCTGSIDIDNYRAISIAELTPCIVASIEYRLVTKELRFPSPLQDCYAAYSWLQDHAADLGADPQKIALHGTSAGGCLAEGLALYLRDKGEQAPVLTILNCPVLTPETTVSKLQFGELIPFDKYRESMEAAYTGLDGNVPSYYAMPLQCRDIRGLGPQMVIVAEYDPLRDEGLEYANRLLKHGVPCEIICAPRVTHGFCVVDHPLTHLIHRSVAGALRREFHMEITEI